MYTYDSYVTVMTKKNTSNVEKIFSNFKMRDSEILSVEKLDGGSPSVWGVNLISNSTLPLSSFLAKLSEKMETFAAKNKMSVYDTDILEEGGY